MKVGFFAGNIFSVSFGGGFTFQTTIIEALRRAKCSHILYIYYHAEHMLFPTKDGNLRFVNVTLETNPQTDPHPLNTLAERDKIELMYYITPFYSHTLLPFVLTVWDVEHRLHPFFPELSVSGLTLPQREQYYADIIPRAYRTVIGSEIGKHQICRYYDIDPERVCTIPLPVPGYIWNTRPDMGILARVGVEPHRYLF